MHSKSFYLLTINSMFALLCATLSLSVDAQEDEKPSDKEKKSATHAKAAEIESKASSASATHLEIDVHANPKKSPRISVYGQRADEIAQSTAHIDTDDPLVAGSDRLEDFVDSIPGVLGVYGGTAGGGSNSAVSIRGFVLSEDFHADGITTAYLSTVQDPALFEGVDVAKGLDSVLFGSGRPGGSINFVSKKPGFKKKRTLSILGGIPSKLHTVLDINGPLNSSPDWAGRVVIIGQKAETSYDNVGNDRFVFSPQLLWKNENQILILRLKHNWQNREFGSHTVFNNDSPVYNISYVDPRAYTNHQSNEVSINYDRFFNDSWAASLKARYSDVRIDYREINFDGFSEVRNQLNGKYEEGQNNEKNHALRTELTRTLETEKNQHTTTFGVSNLAFDIGLKDANPVDDYVFALDVYNPVFDFSLPRDDQLLHREILGKWKEDGVYLQQVSNLNEKLFISAGARSSHRSTERIMGNNSEDLANARDVSTSFGIAWQANPEWKLFTSHVESYDTNLGFDKNNNPLTPQQSTQFEAGVRYEKNTGMKEPVKASFSAYKIKQKSVKDSYGGKNFFFTTVGEVHSQGLEASLNLPLSEKLHLETSYNYNDSRVVNNDVDYYIDRNGQLPYVDNPFDLENKRLSGRPYHQGVLHLDYTPKSDTQLSLQAVHVGKRPGNSSNTFAVPGFTRLDASAQLKLDKNTKFTANIYNLLDKDYVAGVSGRSEVWQGPKRQVSVGLQFDF